MTMTIDIFGAGEYGVSETLMQEVVVRTFAHHGVKENFEMSISIVGEERMKELHKQYLETFEATDVVSFPVHERVGEYPPDADGVIRMGDLVICYPVAVRQAKEMTRTVEEEIQALVEHGCLHLLAIHHEE